MNFAIFGGTFDPIHYGHLFIAEEVRTKLQLDKIVFIPTGRSPHKKDKSVSSKRHRYEMTMLAIASNPCFEASDLEQKNNEVNYTVNTIKRFIRDRSDIENLYFIIGADTLLQLRTWRNISELFKMCKFVVVSRPGFDDDKVKQEVDKLEKENGIKIINLKAKSLQISSSDIRERVKNFHSIRYTIPEEVRNYIYRNGLYVDGS
ncbi:nicotinate-nucleotide adenylyltransferase [Clostridiaceae bacterium M8S5]|nr:nicotinate-nucleotide adenylyltransferase [Clostridiaceae bacterium M8S5]